MFKRALMLTAATIALLSGPAYADNTKPLKTSTSGNIDIETGNNLNIPSSSTASTTPAVEIDSGTTSKPATVTVGDSAQLNYTGTASAVGIQADAGKVGEIVINGTVALTGSGSDKTGILIGTTDAGTSAAFTGIKDTTNNPNSTNKTALALISGGSIQVQGDGSYGIHLQSGGAVVGDLSLSGQVLAETSDTTASSNSGGAVGVELGGAMTGDLLIGTTGSIEGLGAGSQGVVVLGKLDGSIQNLGVIEAVGTSTPTTTKTTNPVSGSALVVSNSVTGGIYNGGPLVKSDGNTSALIEADGSTPAILIQSGFNSTTAAPITLGDMTDPGATFGTVSFLNRGNIESSPLNPDLASDAIAITGLNTTNTLTLSSGIVNAGSITAAATSDATAKTANSVISANAVAIGGYTYLGTSSTGVTTAGWTSAAFINSNSTGGGTITASESGASSGISAAIQISQYASVPSLYNSGTITATAATNDTTVSSLSAYGIYDQSGTLQNIYNSNTGSISAAASAVVAGVVTPLDNYKNVARAIDLEVASGPVTITNAGFITGDIYLGAENDTITSIGTSSTNTAVINGDIKFGNGNDSLTVGNFSTVTGRILQAFGGSVAIHVENGGTLAITNNGATTTGNLALPADGNAGNLLVSNLTVDQGATFGITLANAYNINQNGNVGPIVEAVNNGTIHFDAQSVLKVNFGSFINANNVGSNGETSAKFVVFDAATGNIEIGNPTQIRNALSSGIPFLFEGNVCSYGVSGFDSCGAATGNPEGSTHSDVVLSLTPKTAKQIGLTGYANQMFDPVNAALVNDTVLGAAVINAGQGIDNSSQGKITGQKVYQGIYSEFAPDVTGSGRAIAISLTDQSSGIVGARQRALRMYAGQDADVSLWAQEFGQRINVPNKTDAGGYSNSGFGFAMGMDGGSVSSGRYGGALTFYTGDTSEKEPRLSKTTSEWYMLTGYQDWRGRGLFFDSQVSAAYGHLDGKRTLIIDDQSGTQLIARTAQGKRSSEMAAAGFTTGFIMNAGGTVFIPQFSVDGLTLREEGYTESGGGTGMDLHVEPHYDNSLRAFLGADLRQDLKIGSFYLQPEARAGYRYDFLQGAEKLKAWFAGDQTTSPVTQPGNPFTIRGPDPAKGNLVAGGGLAITTDAWSIGANYDYVRGFGGTDGTDQTIMLTLLGRI